MPERRARARLARNTGECRWRSRSVTTKITPPKRRRASPPLARQCMLKAWLLRDRDAVGFDVGIRRRLRVALDLEREVIGGRAVHRIGDDVPARLRVQAAVALGDDRL